MLYGALDWDIGDCPLEAPLDSCAGTSNRQSLQAEFLLMKVAPANSTAIPIKGASALVLDLDHDTYPFVTSSNAGLGGVNI